MSNLTRYGQTALDKTFPDADESVFGHMVLELGMSPDEATQNLRPWVRDLDRSAELGKKTAYMAAFIGAGAGLATAAMMGIGLTAILPIAAAAYNFFAGQQSAREQGVRESEYLLLKTCPELLKLIYALTQKGMPKEALVECYDDLLGAFTMQFQQRASLGMSDELDHDIVKSFQRIVQEKCEAESLARAIVAETENFTFDTLYQPTEPKAESLPAAPIATASPIGTATKLGAVEVPASPAAQTSSPTALSIIVSDPYQSRAFFGAQRTGKSYLAAVASRQISESLGCKVYHINLASFGDEDGYYWSHAVKSLTCDLSSLGGYEASQMIGSAIELVKAFYSTQNAILIVDEIAYCGSTVAAHKDALADLMRIMADKITTLSSSGKKRMQAIWTIAPEFVAGSLTQDAKAVKKLKLCYVSVHPDASINWQGQAIGFDWELFSQIKANYTISDPICVPSQERICFIGSDWVPVGELPDLKKGNSTKLETSIVDPVTHLENSLKASDDDADDVFSKFAATLTHESQANLKAFVLWLASKKGTEVSYDQIKDSFARRANVGRNKEAIMPLVYAAKSKRLITFLPNSNWLVSDG
jgi:hypothetical protein